LGKKQKVNPQVEQAKSLSIVDTPSAGESALTGEATGLMDWIKAGDYRTRPKNLFFNFADPAERARQRETMMNAGGQGIFALGSPSPNLLALNKQNLNDHWARDEAGQYEQDVSQAGIRAAGELGDVANLENARKTARLGATTSSFNTQLARPRWWETLLAGAQRGASAAAAGAGGG